jgi:ankyrin repeat protein
MKTTSALVGCCLALLLAAPADVLAQAGADPDLARGVTQVEEGDFEAGIATLDTVVKKIGADRTRSRDLTRAYLYLAIAYLSLSEEAAARARVIDALNTDPRLTLSPTEFSPKVIDFVNRIKAQTTKPAPARPRASPETRAAFFEAVRRGDFAAVREALAEHPSLVSEKEPQFGATALHWAALRGNGALVGLLLAQGADTSAANDAGETPVQVAQRAKRPEIVDLLRPMGPLQKLIDAARLGDLTRVQQLVAQDRSLVNQKDAAFGATALHWAVLRGHRSVVEHLLASGADRSLRNASGETPLQVAIRAKRSDLVGLLQAGATSGATGAPPPSSGAGSGDLLEAVKGGDVSRVREIVAADPKALGQRDPQFGATPLHWAALRGYREIAAFLVGAGADLNATNNSGETPLVVAQRAGKKDVAELLRRSAR